VTSLFRDQILLSIKKDFTARELNMDNNGKWKLFTISGKISVLVQVDAHIGSHIEPAPCLTLQCRSQYLIPEGFKSHAAVVRI
jgi:hypothetical protein